VIVLFPPDVLARLVPGDSMVVRGFGQGATLPGAPDVVLLNADPAALVALLPVEVRAGAAHSWVRAAVPSALVGNGIGRPAELWDLDLSVDVAIAPPLGLAGLRLGDLVAVDDLDVRHNAGYRRGWRTVGIVVHGASPQPGHGPGLMPLLCAPAGRLPVDIDGGDRPALRLDHLDFRP
jgi:hypothetical protein